jgi:hypothetical protein
MSLVISANVNFLAPVNLALMNNNTECNHNESFNTYFVSFILKH